jgi:hypothetical protein
MAIRALQLLQNIHYVAGKLGINILTSGRNGPIPVMFRRALYYY